jgi:peptidyl-prolyl cis-trans isomerase A (cyclophilin A)
MNRAQFLCKLSLVIGLAFLSQLPLQTATAAPDGTVTVLMKTSLGDITVELDPHDAPISVANFMNYVDSKAYDGTIFHRVVPGFCVQGGGFTADFSKEISEGHTAIKDEGHNGLHNERGTIAMARTSDPDSATSQFFFNLVDNSQMLDAGGQNGPDGYAVFGKIVKGLDVMDKIAAVATTTKVTGMGPMENVPVDNVVLISVTRVK